MKKVKYALLYLLLLFLIGCNTKVTEEDLIGEYWVGTAGYKDGKPEGELNCLYYVTAGLKFNDGDTVYVEDYENEFEYILGNYENKTTITFSDENHFDNYFIEKIGEDEIGLIGGTEMQKEESCYLERQ